VVKTAIDPIVLLTFPVTNPGNQSMSLAVAKAALAANDNAIVVIDNAYRGAFEIEGLARFSLAHERSIYINTASKDLFLCGARFGWAIAAKPLLDRLSSVLPPYGVGSDALIQGLRVLTLPEALRAARLTQATARDILIFGMCALNIPMQSGVGPWVLVYFGSEASAIVDELALVYRIDVQRQTASLDGWIRISATVPREAESIVNAIADILSKSKHSTNNKSQFDDFFFDRKI
jgi:histidinol-phosphate/aromatic aminotransferase/cobyric acid decarboxylase-like protein